jgi:hypothetical protein
LLVLRKKKQEFLHTAIAWLLAGLVTYVLASVAHTQAVLAGIVSLGVPVPFEDRLRVTAGDIAGLYMYGVIILIGLAIGYSVMGLVGRWLRMSDWLRYPLGGALAMLTILLSMKLALSITPIAGARELSGLAMQCLAGGIGGWVFSRLLRRVSR